MKHNKIIATSLGVLLLASTGMAQTAVIKGNLRREVWGPNRSTVTRAQVEAGTAGAPDTDAISLTSFETGVNWADNYVQRVSGVFLPPVTGKYVFIIATDDDSDLFLNLTNDNASGKVIIAQETGWAGSRSYSGGNLVQKRSDTYTPDAGVTVPYAGGIQLTASKPYYIEAVHHEGGGGDNLAVTYKLIADPDPVDGDAPLLTGDVIGVTVILPTAFGIQTQVKDASAYESTEATFSFTTTNNATPPIAPLYQWYRNGVLITNATGTQLTFLATPADTGAKYKCVATLAPPINQTLTSAEGTLTVKSGSITAPGIKWENFASGPTRPSIEAGNTGPATTISLLDRFELPIDRADNYGTRLSGYFIAPASGQYVFFVASDDDSDLFLSTDMNPANKRLIAQELGWSGARNWVTAGDAATTSMKRSDTWSPDGGFTMPWSSGIALTSGTKYYIEMVHHEGGGGDNLSATYKLMADADPADGDYTKMAVTNNNIEAITAPVTTLTITTQPQSVSVFAGQSASFSVVTATDGELSPLLQWYRNGQAITNATGTTYKLVTGVADNGAQFQVIAQTPVGGLSVTSSVATLTVKTPVFEKGLVKYERFPGSTRPDVENGVAPDPAYTTTYNIFQGPTDAADNFASRMSGLFVPKTTGRYVFFVCSDDDTDLFLSTDDTAANKRLIAQETGWSGARNWVGVGGGSTPEQKRSDSFSPDNGATMPFASGIQLNAGTKYYIEAVHHEGGGGDNLGATFKLITDPDPVAGDNSLLTGDLVGFNAPAASYVAFEQQPANATVAAGGTATFTAKAISDSTISIGGNPNQLVMYQWYKGGTEIAGATLPSYTTPLVTIADNGAQYVVGARALGIAAWSNSVTAVLTVNADTVKPTIQYAAAFTNVAAEAVLSITFSELMDATKLAVPANYVVPGATVTAVTVNPNAKSVILTLSGNPTSASVTVNNVTDFSGNALASATAATQKVSLKPEDIGIPGVDPVFPSLVYVDGANAYTISAQGSDIWNAADGCNFLYEQKTGNFDVVVRQKSIMHTSQWAKGGLMIRESLAAGARNWNIINDPVVSDGIAAPDGSGMGANVVECNSRTETDVASNHGWDNVPPSRDVPPAYPNAWVRLARTNDVITAYLSANGSTWRKLGVEDASKVGSMTSLPATLYVGITVTAHNNDVPGNEPYKYWNTCEFADYNSNFVESSAPPTMSLSQVGGVWKITYEGTLTSSATADGSYTPVAGAVSPYTVDTSAGAKFFRARR